MSAMTAAFLRTGNGNVRAGYQTVAGTDRC